MVRIPKLTLAQEICRLLFLTGTAVLLLARPHSAARPGAENTDPANDPDTADTPLSAPADGAASPELLAMTENSLCSVTLSGADGDSVQKSAVSQISSSGTDHTKNANDPSADAQAFIAPPEYEGKIGIGRSYGEAAKELVVTSSSTGSGGSSNMMANLQNANGPSSITAHGRSAADSISDRALVEAQIVTISVETVNGAPVITSNGGGATATVAVNENQTAVTTVTATDDDPSATKTYSLVSSAGTDFGKFTINSATGVLTFLTAPDFEAPTDVGGTDGDNAYEVVVVVYDGALTDTQTITVNVQDINAAPAITSNGGGGTATVNVNENQTAVTTVAAADDGENVAKTYSLVSTAGTDYGKFSINSSTGVLTFIAPPDFENPTDVGGVDGDNAYEVVVQVSDGALTDIQTITVNVQDLNAAPAITSNGGGATASVNVNENQTAVTTVAASDDGENTNAMTYSIVNTAGTDYANFAINGTTGVLTFIAPPDYEAPTDIGGPDGDNAYVVVVQASDGVLTDTQTVTVTVQNVNAAPVITSNGGGATASVNVNENQTAVTTVAATDDGENTNARTYSIVATAGTDFAKFAIDATTGVLTFIAPPNFEAPTDIGGVDFNNAYEVVVQVSDGALTDTQTITVNVQNVNAAPSITSDGGGATASVNVDENLTSPVTTVVATDDGENTNTKTYSILSTAGTDYAKFAINSTTGVLTFIAPPDYESPTDVGGADGDNAYEVIVQVSDGALTDTQTITVNVQDLNAAPIITSLGGGTTAVVNADENQTAVTTVVASDDGENINSKTYSIVNTAGTDFAKFAINASTGVLTFIAAPDYETPTDVGGPDGDNAYEVVVQVSDGVFTDTQTITVNVQNLNGVPVIVSDGGGATASVNPDENQTAVTTVHAVLDDGVDSIAKTYSIVTTAGTDFAKFAIDPSTGVLTFIAPPNYEAPTDVGGVDGDNAYEVVVQVLDAALIDTQTITVHVQNVNLAPTITSDGGGATASVSADENQTAVTTVVATDDGENTNTKTYSIVATAGTDFAKFAINSTTGVLTFITAPNYEAPTDIGGPDGDNAYEVVVQVSDGLLTDTQTITVNVQDLNTAPVITSNGGGATASVNADENQTAVTTMTATDDGENATKTYSLVNTAGTDFAKFAINSTTGALTFIAAPDFEAPTDVGGVDGDNAYEVVVQVSDGALTDTQTITVNVQDLNEAPSDIIWNAVTPASDTDIPDSVVIANLTTVDSDNLGGFTYSLQSQSIVSGSDANGGGFAVSEAGAVSASSMVDGNTYLLVIRSQDVNAAFVDESFNVITGTSGANTLPTSGVANPVLTGDDILYGTEGNDLIFGGSGNDTLFGQADDDQLTGGTGEDLLVGGLGNDIFYFNATGESSATLAAADTIADFSHGVDKISLAAIDANSGTGGDDAFIFGGNNVNTAAFSVTWSESGGDTILHIDNNGDTTADMQIVLTGTGLNLDATDFLL